MKEIIKIERFLEAFENTWAFDEFTFVFCDYTLPTEFTLHVGKDFGDYPDLIGFEAEILTIDKSLINEKIKSINSLCDKMISDSDIYMSKLKRPRIDTYKRNVESYLTSNYNEDNTKVIKFNDVDLIYTMGDIQSIIARLPADKDQLTTKANDNRLKFIWQLLIDEELIHDKTQLKDWLYWFGKNTIEEPKKIKWIGADYNLSNVILQICGASSEKLISNAFEFKAKYQKPTTKKYITTLLRSQIDGYLHHAETKLK